MTGGPGAGDAPRPPPPSPDDDDGLRAIFEHTRGLGEKDLQLALDLGAELGIDLPFATLAHQHLGAALGVPHLPQEQP